jgi:hypothetical protein
MRAQLSLMFDDENLFDNFVKPYKDEKLLNNLIIKCLSAYYYNEEVRNLIEGTSLDDVADSEEVTSTQSLVDGIRASLIMQDFLASELQNTIDAGTEDVSSILNRTNEAAEKSGVAKTTQTEYGASVLKIEQHNLNLGASQESSTSTDTATEPNDTLKILIMAVSKLAEASGNSEVVNLLHSSSASEQTVVQSDVSKTESVIPKQEVLNEQAIAQPVSEVTEPVTSNNFEVEEDFVEETPVITKDDFAPEQISDIASQVEKPDAGDTATTKVPANIEEDASDAIGELLGSLF